MLARPDRSTTSTHALVRLVLTMVFALQWEILTGDVSAVMVGRVELVTAPVTPSAVKKHVSVLLCLVAIFTSNHAERYTIYSL
jgi:hypothetical protein